MRLFRRVPTPFAITYLVSSLLRESVQKRKADKYAAQAVHYYKPGESPYPSRTVGTLEEELETPAVLFFRYLCLSSSARYFSGILL